MRDRVNQVSIAGYQVCNGARVLHSSFLQERSLCRNLHDVSSVCARRARDVHGGAGTLRVYAVCGPQSPQHNALHNFQLALTFTIIMDAHFLKLANDALMLRMQHTPRFAANVTKPDTRLQMMHVCVQHELCKGSGMSCTFPIESMDNPLTIVRVTQGLAVGGDVT